MSNDGKPSITLLPTLDLTGMQKSLEVLKADFDTYLEFQKLMAKLNYAKYRALVEEGFSEKQAMKLCTQ